jgi:iron complex outermembrane receptor protein
VGVTLLLTSTFANDLYAQSRYAIEEVVITSRKVEEGLQDAPLAVTALTGLELENRGATDVVDFADIAPNVTLKSDGATSGFGAAPRTSIRGIGQSDFVINTDPAVGIYADGVYLGRSLGSVLDLLDVERVEALRGPQGTLFGRNSVGGAINIISKKPAIGEDASGYISAAIGEDGYRLLRGSANMPLGENAAARASIYKKEKDGFIPALQYDNLDLGAEDVWGFRAAIQWQPTESLTVDIDGDVSTRSDSPAPQVASTMGDLSVGETGLDQTGPRVTGETTSIIGRIYNGEPASPTPPPTHTQYLTTDASCASNQAYRDSSLNCVGNAWAGSRDGANTTWYDAEGNQIIPEQNLESYGYAARLTWENEHVTVKSISSWRGFDADFINGAPAPILISSNNNDIFKQDQFTQELNISGSTEKFDWVVGGFYMEEDGHQRVTVLLPYVPPSFNNDPDFLPINGIENRYIDNTSTAIYGQVISHLTESIDLTLGVRNTDSDKEASFVQLNDNFVDETIFEAEQSASEVNVLVNLSWHIADETMVYAQYSDGFRDGGFPSRIPAGTTTLATYDPEYVDAYELGLKTTFLDGRIRTNVAIFDMAYTDMQISATQLSPEIGSVSQSVDNLGESSISGFELEGNFLVNDYFRIDSSIGYLKTTIDSLVSGGVIINDGTNMRKVVDTSHQLAFTPEWQFNIGANYSKFLNNGAEIRSRIDYIYEADQYTNIANYAANYLPSTYKVNFNTSYIPEGAQWELTLGIRNLTDEQDIANRDVNTALGNGIYTVYGRGREGYLQFKYSFGE